MNIDIDTLSRELNLGKDRLRVWERRYGFPRPQRRQDGQRVYPIEQLERLRLICRLLDGGARAGEVLPLCDEALAQRLEQHQSQAAQALPGQGKADRLHAMLQQLHQLPDPDPGLPVVDWIERHVEPFTALIGTAWQAGQLPIWGEHLLTEGLERRLASLLSRQPNREGGIKVLICTQPDEQHRLGMLMAELAFREAGARTLCLGTEVPIDEITSAAMALDADLLALSYSCHQKRKAIIATLTELRTRLPQLPLWIGGNGASHLRKLPQGVMAVRHIQDIQKLLAELL